MSPCDSRPLRRNPSKTPPSAFFTDSNTRYAYSSWLLRLISFSNSIFSCSRVCSPSVLCDCSQHWSSLDMIFRNITTVSYTHLRAHETRHDLVCRLLLEKTKTYSNPADFA